MGQGCPKNVDWSCKWFRNQNNRFESCCSRGSSSNIKTWSNCPISPPLSHTHFVAINWFRYLVCDVPNDVTYDEPSQLKLSVGRKYQRKREFPLINVQCLASDPNVVCLATYIARGRHSFLPNDHPCVQVPLVTIIHNNKEFPEINNNPSFGGAFCGVSSQLIVVPLSRV